MPSVEPGLKPYQPNHRMKVPSTTRLALWPGIGFTLPASNRPMRGPSTVAPASAAAPPTMCTTPQPAKSTTPMPSIGSLEKAESQPSLLQIQCTTTG